MQRLKQSTQGKQENQKNLENLEKKKKQEKSWEFLRKSKHSGKVLENVLHLF